MQVSGRLTLDNLALLEGEESDLPERMHLRDIPDEQLVRIWQAVVRGDKQALLEHSVVANERLPPYVRDYYGGGA